MRLRIATLTLALAACSFDESGVRAPAGDDDGDDDAPMIDAGPTADPIDAASTPNPVVPDATPSECNFDTTCSIHEAGWCPECVFVCDYDQSCDNGEDPFCLDCL